MEPMGSDSSEAELEVKLPKGVELCALDFDQTLVRCHTCAEGVRPTDVPGRPPQGDAVDFGLLKAIANAAEESGAPLVVATFGSRAVVEAYLGILLGPERVYVCTPRDVGGKEGKAMRGGKVPQLELLRRRFRAKRSRVLFLDDSVCNVRGARAAGYTKSFAVPSGLHRGAWGWVVRRCER